MRVKGRWYYLYRAIASRGATIAFVLSCHVVAVPLLSVGRSAWRRFRSFAAHRYVPSRLLPVFRRLGLPQNLWAGLWRTAGHRQTLSVRVCSHARAGSCLTMTNPDAYRGWPMVADDPSEMPYRDLDIGKRIPSRNPRQLRLAYQS